MSFGEASRKKSMCQVDFNDGEEPVLELIPVPIFQKLARIEGNEEALVKGMRELAGTGAWLELVMDSEGRQDDPRARLEKEAEKLGLEIIRIRDLGFKALALAADASGPDLASLEHSDVFDSLLEQSQIPEGERAELRATYAQVVASLFESDERAD